jgi:hypothetical protein
MRRAVVIVVVVGGLLLTGCVPSGQAAARQAGDAFQASLAARNAPAACALLSEKVRDDLESSDRQSCSTALSRLPLPTGATRSIQVWGDAAQIRLTSGVLFLAKFTTGWKITAAGCVPRPELPYRCDLGG